MNLADKTGIIGQLWIEFRNDEDFAEFMEYNDLGCPMAYMVAEGLVKELTPIGEDMINETFNMFSKLLEISEEEIDGLEVINLQSVLEFAYAKRQGKSE